MKLIEHIAIAAMCAFLVFIVAVFFHRAITEVIFIMLFTLVIVLIMLEVGNDDLS